MGEEEEMKNKARLRMFLMVAWVGMGLWGAFTKDTALVIACYMGSIGFYGWLMSELDKI